MPRARHLIVSVVCAVALVGGWLAGRDVGPSLTPVATGTAAAPVSGDVVRREPRTRAATDESPARSDEKPNAPAKPPGRLFVHVVASDDDAPIAGAVVRPSYTGDDPRSATTDANGDAQIDVPMTAAHPDAADTYFSVTAAGRVPESVNAEVAAGAEQRETVRMRVGFSVSGFVHDAAGKPIAGAHIVVTEHGGCITPYPEIAEQEGDADGRFRIDGLPLASPLGFEFTAPGHVRRTLGRRPHDTKPLDVSLAAGDVIRGVVRTPDGAPAAGARVIAAVVAEDDVRRVADIETWTGEDGAFVLDTLDAGHVWTLVARDSDFMESEESPEVTPGADAKCDLRLRPAARVVIDLDFTTPRAAAIAGLTLPDEPDRDCPVPGRTTTVVTTPGEFHVDADLKGLRWAQATGVARPGETTTVTIRFDEGASIAGVVVDDLGAPVAGAIVKIDDYPRLRREATSAGDGTFVLNGLDVAKYAVKAAAPGHGPAAADASAPADALRLVVPRGGEVVARLRLPDGAAAPATRKVHWNGYPAESADDETPWSDGMLVRSLPPANYIVEIDVDGCVKWEKKDVAVVAGGRVDLGEVALDRGLPLSGRVVDVDGHGVAFVSVFADDDLGKTDSDGRFTWPHLAAGKHEVRVPFPLDFLEAAVDVTLTKDTPPIVVTLHRGALLSVRVTGASPKDAEMMNVQAFAADAPVGEEAEGGRWLGGSLANGFVERLPAGPLRIEVRRENDVLATRHVELREGEDVEIEIALP